MLSGPGILCSSFAIPLSLGDNVLFPPRSQLSFISINNIIEVFEINSIRGLQKLGFSCVQEGAKGSVYIADVGTTSLSAILPDVTLVIIGL